MLPSWGSWATSHWFNVSVVAFLVLAAAETIRPDGRIRPGLVGRWVAHFGVYALDVVLGSMLIPGLVLLVADQSQGPGQGQASRLFGAIEAAVGPALGPWAVLLAGLLAIDLGIYAAHRLQHRFELLWRFHAVHHADQDMDLSTALRHHPFAYLLTAACVGVTLFTAGMPGWVFSIYALAEIPCGAFQHMATPIPDRVERSLRWLLVTPGMHQLHHSTDPAHHHTNFASILSLWDRMFGTFRTLPADDRAALGFGVEPYGNRRGTAWMLTMPFRMRPASAADSIEPRRAQAVQQP